MIQLTYFIFILLSICTILLNLNFLIANKSTQDREKLSPFECGFDPMSSPRMPFSIQFFLISLIFLIFDIEIALLIPLILMYKIFNLPMILTSLMFIMILIFGLLLEYSEQSMDWKI